MNVVPVEQIRTEARKVQPVPALLLVIGGLLYWLGFGVAFVVNILWIAVTLFFASLKVGWRDGTRAARAYR